MIKHEITGIKGNLDIVETNFGDIMHVTTETNNIVIRIDGDGRIYWEGREVTTDEDFRNCIMTMMAIMSGRPTP